MSFLAVHLIPYILKQWANGIVSLNRIESFLVLQETEGSKESDKVNPLQGDQAFVKIKNLFATYDSIDESTQFDAQSFALENKFSNQNDLDKNLSKRHKKINNDQYELKDLDQNDNFKSKKFSNYKIVLNNINFEILPGQLLSLVGPTGSGKSSCLMAILKEINSVNKESVAIYGRISYCSQGSYT